MNVAAQQLPQTAASKLDFKQLEDSRTKTPNALKPSGLQDANYALKEWFCRVPPGHSRDDVLSPEYWRHVAAQLKPHNEIRVQFEDGSRWMLLLVLDCGGTWAKVKVLHDVVLDDATNKEIEQLREGGDDEYEVKYVSPALRYCVVRKADGEYIYKNGQLKEDAEKYLLQFKQALKK